MLSIFHFHPFSANWLVDDGYGLLVRRFSQIETSLHFVGGFPMFDSRSAGAQQSRQINKTIKTCHFHPGPTPLKGGYRKPMKHTWKSHQRVGDNTLRSAFDARFVEVCHPRSQKLDDIRQMVPHLQFNIMTDWGELDSSDGIRWAQKI